MAAMSEFTNTLGDATSTGIPPSIPEARTHFHWRPRIVCERRSDNTLWVPSHPGHPYGFGWYFRRVRRVAGRLYREVGEVWSVEDPGMRKNATIDDTIRVTRQWQYLKGREQCGSITTTIKELAELLTSRVKGLFANKS